jgi:hypothetical protein
MYGLVKIADDQNLNLNHASREDRLLEDVEAARERLEAAEASRNPEVVTRAQNAFLGGTGIGAGVGAGIGAGVGALTSPGMRGPGAFVGGVAGLGLGIIPGAIGGGIRASRITQNEEDPAVLRELDAASSHLMNKQDKLERHYLTRQRILEQEARRQELRRELLGY